MKTMILFLVVFLSLPVFSQSIKLNDYNWFVTDIAELNVKKEKLFSSMDRDLIKVGNSICSNRALMWVYDFKRDHNIDAAKIFLFYTRKTGEVGRKTWWYHVSPVINEKGKLWTMDAGFPYDIDSPLLINDWIKSFIGGTNCKEINAGENDLIERMFSNRVFPEVTSYGTYDCYYKVVPAGYWTPSSVAMNLLGVDSEGNRIDFKRDSINRNEVYDACIEATTSSFGRFLGNGKKKCKKFLAN